MSYFFRLLATACAFLAAVLPGHAQAGMTIEIVGAAANRIPLVIAPFLPAGASGDDPAEIIRADLSRSGLFKLVDSNGLGKPGEAQAVDHAQWRARGADALVVGQVSKAADGRLDIRFRLYDVVRKTQLAGFSYLVPATLNRAIAHKIADLVHEKLIGEPGNFSGRVAYILKHNGRYELQVADSDGVNAFTVVRSPEPIISPVWSPNGAKLAYVSFEHKKPVVYVQSLTDGRRKAVANFRGSNYSPAWSPDGSKLAISLSKDDIAQLYLISADGGDARRLSKGGALETEPAFSPDGKWLYFTSDRGGSPQIYRMPVEGGEANRMTFEGAYNVSPAISPDGKYLAYVRRDGGSFHVAVLDLENGQTQVLTNTQFDESPSFAPNSRNILYATMVNGRGVLATVSVDGRVKQRLTIPGDLREPAWAP
ncbi:MAG: Tol-Pal system beta propeller repeat protein TolB [Hydrogenophilaceae bacterium]